MKSFMSENKNDEDQIPEHLVDELMRSVFNNIFKNKNRSLKSFVVFEEGDTIVDIPYNFSDRLIVIDRLISYFEKTEEYEKCQDLLNFKNLAGKYWCTK